MKACQENFKKSCEKGVSFGALETIERNSDSIDKLTSLVSKLDMKLDKRETQYRPRIYQARNRGCSQRQDIYRSRDRSYSRECSEYNKNRGRRNFNNDRNYRPNCRARSRSGNGFRRNDRYDSRPNYRRDNFRQDQRYRNRSISQDHNRSRQRFRNNSGTVQEIGINTAIEAKAEVEIEGKGPELLPEKGKVDPEQNQGLDQVPC